MIVMFMDIRVGRRKIWAHSELIHAKDAKNARNISAGFASFSCHLLCAYVFLCSYVLKFFHVEIKKPPSFTERFCIPFNLLIYSSPVMIATFLVLAQPY